MNNESFRIRVNLDDDVDKFIKVKLEQDVRFLDILSLRIDQRDSYQFFNADYGVLVGRVNANGRVGIPNAKVSIFIPIDEEDQNNPDIKAIYPYENPRDTNIDGKRYNLLPRVAKFDQESQSFKPQQPFGSFPIKEEILTNETWLEVYKKYYKYTTVTNDAGDYMLFGIPTGVQTVHMSVDITDIGQYSMTPASMITNLGYSPNLFTDNGTRIKPSNDLNDLPNIETQEISVDVIPFWGDSENFDIGITRQDFRIRAELINTFTLFGSVFTDGDLSSWGSESDGGIINIRELYDISNNGTLNVSIASKRTANVIEQIFTLPSNISDAEIQSNTYDPINDYQLLDSSFYSSYKRDGDFAFIINCNRNRIITDEFGNQIPVSDSSSEGVFTEFVGFATFEISSDDVPLNFTGEIGNNATLRSIRLRFKFPQSANRNESFTKDDSDPNTEAWRRQNYRFEANKIYSVARFHGLVHNNNTDNDAGDVVDGFSKTDDLNIITVGNPNEGGNGRNTGIIFTNTITDDGDIIVDNDFLEFVPNGTNNNTNIFGANWLNFSIHFPQHSQLTNNYTRTEDFRSNTSVTRNFQDPHFYRDNLQKLSREVFNTKYLARSDLHYTDFIRVTREDLVKFAAVTTKGFKDDDVSGSLTGDYRNGFSAVPENGGKIGGNPSNSTDPRIYFYKGLGASNCIQFILDLGLL
ncbi:MAG: hypothetical protein ACOCVF_01705 [bacterium]